MKWKIDNLAELENVAREVVARAEEASKKSGHAVVIALHGNLGAGKTTFTKHLAKVLGIEENVVSPTFVIQKQFKISDGAFSQLIHIDTYRIDLQDELVRLGWAENVAEKGNLIAVEWPENIPDLLPENTIHIYFTHVNDTTREIEIK